MPKYETHEVRLSELIKHYIADLPKPEGWEILAIDLFTDVLVLKREISEISSSETPTARESANQPEADSSLNITVKTLQGGGD